MSLDEDPQGLIPKAGQLLTTLAFCRSQAEALHACHESGASIGRRVPCHPGRGSHSFTQRIGSRLSSAGGACRKENDIFLKCASDSAPLVVETMVKLAIKHCPEEVRAHQQCVQNMGKSKCKNEDLAAMWCASQQVMRAAAEETRGR